MAQLYLFDTSKFTPLEQQGKNFISANVTIRPSLYFQKAHRDNVLEICENEKGYILCPYYLLGNYQLLITGKSVDKMDNTIEDAVKREAMEEAGLMPSSIIKTKHGYSTNINKCSSYRKSYNPYANLVRLTFRQFKKYEQNNKHTSQKLNIVVHGELDDFKQIYEDKIIARPKFAERDIIGFLLIPIELVKSDLVNSVTIN